MPNKLDVLIFYEHKLRDLPACCLLAYELNRRGYSVKISHNDAIGIWRYRIFSHPRITIGPGALLTEIGKGWRCIDNYTSFLKGGAEYYINLQAEQILSGNENIRYNVITTSEWIDRIYYICWGEKRRNQLIKCGVPPKKILVSGAIQLDFLSEPIKEFYESKEKIALKYHISSSKKWILYISSFALADMSQEELSWNASAGAAQSEDVSEYLSNLQTFSSESKHGRDAILKWFDQFLNKSANAVIIYRSHPGESIGEELISLSKRYPDNFILSGQEPLQQWILICDLIDIWLTTAVADIHFANRPCLLLCPFQSSNLFIPETINMKNVITDYDDFYRIHKELLFSGFNYQSPINVNRLVEYYGTTIGDAYIKISNLVEELMKNARGTAPTKFRLSVACIKHFIYQCMMSFFAFFKIRISSFCPVFRKRLVMRENQLIRNMDVFFSEDEKIFYRRILEGKWNA